jgi:hypothetical protein
VEELMVLMRIVEVTCVVIYTSYIVKYVRRNKDK